MSYLATRRNRNVFSQNPYLTLALTLTFRIFSALASCQNPILLNRCSLYEVNYKPPFSTDFPHFRLLTSHFPLPTSDVIYASEPFFFLPFPLHPLHPPLPSLSFPSPLLPSHHHIHSHFQLKFQLKFQLQLKFQSQFQFQFYISLLLSKQSDGQTVS